MWCLFLVKVNILKHFCKALSWNILECDQLTRLCYPVANPMGYSLPNIIALSALLRKQQYLLLYNSVTSICPRLTSLKYIKSIKYHVIMSWLCLKPPFTCLHVRVQSFSFPTIPVSHSCSEKWQCSGLLHASTMKSNPKCGSACMDSCMH